MLREFNSNEAKILRQGYLISRKFAIENRTALLTPFGKIEILSLNPEAIGELLDITSEQYQKITQELSQMVSPY